MTFLVINARSLFAPSPGVSSALRAGLAPLAQSADAFFSSLLVLAILAAAPAPQAPDARARVERALEAIGSPEHLIVHAEGTRNQSAERQGRTPDGIDTSPYREITAIDATGDRVAREHRYDRPDGTFEWLREMFEGDDDRMLLVLQDSFAIWFRTPDNLEEKRKYARRLPHFLLAEVLERPDSLRSERPDVVSGVLSDGTSVTLRFEADTHLLSRVEYVTDVQSFGDIVLSWTYSDWSRVSEGVQFPGRIEAHVGDRSFLELDVTDVAVDPERVAAMFTPPDGITLPDEPRVLPAAADSSAGADVREESPGVYTVRNLRGGFHPMFVELGDCVLAVDAPAGYRLLEQLPAGDVAPGASSAWLSERYLELIHETLPGKRVCWVALTHFHNDHAGGIRAFVAEGATLLIAPGDRPAVEALIEAPHTVAPDRLSREPRPASIEVVSERRSLTGGDRTVELIPMGSNPHTDDMLAVFLPDERYLFVSDLLTAVPLDDFPTRSHEELDRAFLAWLDATELDPERVYTMHGSGLATREHLEKLRQPPRIEVLNSDQPIDAAASELPHVEPHLAIDPNDPRHWAVASIVVAPTREGAWRCAAFVTRDAGESFSRHDFDMGSCIDPWVTILDDGTVLVTAIDIGFERPDGERFRLLRWGSGEWTTPIELGTGHDHELMIQDDSGELVLVSRRMDHNASGRPRHAVGVMRSDDSGQSFRRLNDVRPSNLALNATGLVQLSSGALVVSLLDFQRDVDGFERRGQLRQPRAWVVRSDDGGESFTEPLFASEGCGRTDGFAGYPALATDRSRGPFTDRLYHLCVQADFAGLALTTSSDSGDTWTEPLALATSMHVRTPMLAVNKDGVIAAAWYGRTDPEAKCQDLYFTLSHNGGSSFAEPMRVSTETSCPQTEGNGRVAESWAMGGDYGSLAASPDGSFRVVWADSRSGHFQLHHASLGPGGPQ